MGRACRSITSFVARLLVVPWFEFWRPGVLYCSPVRLTLRRLESSHSSSTRSRWLLSGFLPPTAGCSFIGGTSACSGPLLRLTAIYLAFELATAVFHGGGGFQRGYWWSPVFPSFGCGERRRLMYPWCFVHQPVFWSILAYSRLSFVWVFGSLLQVFSWLALSVPVGVRSGFAPADFYSLWFCLV